MVRAVLHAASALHFVADVATALVGAASSKGDDHGQDQDCLNNSHGERLLCLRHPCLRYVLAEYGPARRGPSAAPTWTACADRQGKAWMGFEAKMRIHPNQIRIAKEVFT